DRSVSVLLGLGGGTFSQQVKLTADINPFGLAVGDIDRDGAPDLVCANQGDAASAGNIQVFFNNGAGTFIVNQTIPGGDRPRSVTLGDLNGDGLLDIAVGNNGELANTSREVESLFSAP